LSAVDRECLLSAARGAIAVTRLRPVADGTDAATRLQPTEFLAIGAARLLRAARSAIAAAILQPSDHLAIGAARLLRAARRVQLQPADPVLNAAITTARVLKLHSYDLRYAQLTKDYSCGRRMVMGLLIKRLSIAM
jgi:hypothetical protein